LLRAFDEVADRHGFPRDLPSLDVAREIVRYKIRHPQTYGAVATLHGQVVGSVFMLRADPIAGIGPVTVDPGQQGGGVGRRLVQAAIDEARDRAGVRLTQDAFNVVSLALYAALGFEVKEPLVEMHGRPRDRSPRDTTFRRVTSSDIPVCLQLYQRVHGIGRERELCDAFDTGCSPHLLERDGRVVGYTSRLPLVFDAHGVAETEDDLRALVLAAAERSMSPVSLVVPTRQASFFRWCLNEGLRAVKPMTLMALGEYHQPRGAYFPSVLY